VRVTKYKKGEKTGMPVSLFGGKSGWIKAEMPMDGILIQLNALEKSSGGCFISDAQLAELGYYTQDENRKENECKKES